MFVFLEATLLTEIFELAFVSNRSKETLPTTDILLTVATYFQPLLVVLQAHVRAELLDVRAKPDAVLAQTGGLNILLA